MRSNRAVLAGAAIGIYIIAHLATLAWFPFVHSDEGWLASLSRTMIVERDVAATEDFFVLTPRHPHAIKTLFHLLQIPFVAISFSVRSVRMLSLPAGLASLWFVYRIAQRLGGSRWHGIAAALPLAFDVQFIYASHFARQEILLIAWMLGAVWAAISLGDRTFRALRPIPAGSMGAVVGVIVAASIFVHPNSFIVALAVAPWISTAPWSTTGLSVGRPDHTTNQRWVAAIAGLVVYTAVLSVGAGLAVAASYAMDPQFLRHYGEFGDAVGVGDSALMRLFRLRDFFVKLWTRRAGTYYLPPIRVQLVLLASLTPIAAVAAVFGRTLGNSDSRRTRALRAVALPAVSVVAVVAGLYIVGKYSPPSAVFLMPWLYLMVPLLVNAVFVQPTPATRAVRATTLVLLAMVATASLGEIAQWRPGGVAGESYRVYIERVAGAIDRDAAVMRDAGGPRVGRILANLNTAFAWAPDRLRVYRDLARLPHRESSTTEGAASGVLAAFVVDEGINYLVVPVDELDLIYDRRPLWNEVYGNPNRFYPELKAIIDSCGTVVDEFSAPVYGMRILYYQGRSIGRIRIYRLDPLLCP